MYKYLQILDDKDLLSDLVKQGIISITIVGHKFIYEAYLREKEKGNKTSQAVTNTSIDTKTPESTIYKIIRKMKSSN
jgi:predicted transcriptional regulator